MNLSRPQKRALAEIAKRENVSIEQYPHGPFAANTVKSLEKLGLITVTTGRRLSPELAPSETASITVKGARLI